MINFLDTSAVIAGAIPLYENIYISPLVITELEHIKSSNKSENVKYFARQAVRDILTSKNIQHGLISQRKIDHLLKKYDFLSNINDHRLLCEALLLARETFVRFITNDGALFLFAKNFPQLNALYFEQPDTIKDEEYAGWGKYWPTEKEFNTIYTMPEKNILNARINEYCELYEGDTLKDILRWTGTKYTSLSYKDIYNKFLNTTLRPRNLEQKLAFDLLQNNDITVKILSGVYGSGKDTLMLYHALDMIQKGQMDKLIFIRNLIPFKDAPEIGFLSGNLQEKISWGLGPIRSILGVEGLQQYEEDGIIEAFNLGFIRGMQFNRSIIYISEGQNITGGGYKLLISRCGEGSQIWINGDGEQTDHTTFEKNNGLMRVINSLKGNELVGMVKLIKTERSATAELASRIK